MYQLTAIDLHLAVQQLRRRDKGDHRLTLLFVPKPSIALVEFSLNVVANRPAPDLFKSTVRSSKDKLGFVIRAKYDSSEDFFLLIFL
jgi:hypothetical protein